MSVGTKRIFHSYALNHPHLPDPSRPRFAPPRFAPPRFAPVITRFASDVPFALTQTS